MRGQPRYKLKIVVLLSVVMTAQLLGSTLAVSAMLRASLRRQAEGANEELAGRALARAKNGNPFPCPPSVPDGTYRFYGPVGEFLLLGRCEGGVMKTVKSFF